MSSTTTPRAAASLPTADTHDGEEPRPTERRRSPVCLLVAPLAVGMAVGALVLAGEGAVGPTGSEVARSGLVVLWALAGGALGIRRRQDRLGPIVLGGAAVGALAHLGAVADAAGRGGDYGGGAAGVAVALLPAIGLHLLLSLPDGRLVDQARRRGARFGYVIAAAVAATLVGDWSGGPRWLVILAAVAAAAVGLPPSNTRYEKAGAVDRRRMQWIGWSLAVAAECGLVVVALDLLADWPGHGGVLALLASGLVPVSLIAGTSPRMVSRVDRLLTNTVSLAGLTALVVAIYVVVVLGLGRSPEGDDRGLLVLSMAAAAVAALLYIPARDRLTTFANRLVYGQQVAPDETLRTFGSRLTRAIPLDELLLQLAESLRKTMGLAACEIWTGTDGHLDRVVSIPHAPVASMELSGADAAVVARAGISGGTWLELWLPALPAGRDSGLLRVAPIAHGGELLGLIVLSRRSTAEAFSEEDDRVVVELARQVGLALHNVQLDSALEASLEEVQKANDELRQSRARIVAAGDAERRRLERNLHDGAQQHLVALAVKLRLARDAVEDDPADATAMLDELRGDIQEAVAELRALAHGIFPPLLMSGGLPDALPAAGMRAALATTVTTDGVGRYPTEIETAVYFCCLEALQNAGKHAGDAATVTLRVWEDRSGEGSAELCFEVADDGAGFAMDTATGQGHGFVNMADRLGAINGRLEVIAAPGAGARITGRIPLVVA